MKHVVLLIGISAAFSAQAAKPVLECYRDPTTDSMQCIDIINVRSIDPPVRWASLYTGGPAGVKQSNFFVATNCTTGVTHLKDKQGVSFAGGTGSETPALRKLREIVCSANLKK
jgi:hypothetical protein